MLREAQFSHVLTENGEPKHHCEPLSLLGFLANLLIEDSCLQGAILILRKQLLGVYEAIGVWGVWRPLEEIINPFLLHKTIFFAERHCTIVVAGHICKSFDNSEFGSGKISTDLQQHRPCSHKMTSHQFSSGARQVKQSNHFRIYIAVLTVTISLTKCLPSVSLTHNQGFDVEVVPQICSPDDLASNGPNWWFTWPLGLLFEFCYNSGRFYQLEVYILRYERDVCIITCIPPNSICWSHHFNSYKDLES